MDTENESEWNEIWDEARYHVEAGNYDKAIEIYKYILVRYGDDDTAKEFANANLGDIYLTLHKLEQSETHIKKAIAICPDKPDYHYILGFVYTKRRQWDKAITEFNAAIASQPDDGEYIRGLGWAVFESGDKKKGLNLLLKANDLSPDNPNILTDLAVAYMPDDIYRAEVYAEMAAAIDPNHPVTQNVLDKIRSVKKNWISPDGVIRRDEIRTYSINSHDIYRFKVSLKDKPDIWRMIDIKGNQMLSTLHKGIYKAFDRFDEHAYSFFLKNIPWDKENEYTSPGMETEGKAKLASRIRIDSVELYGGTKFLYLFDFGDEWWHNVELVSVTLKNTRAKYPRIAEKHGKSPPQYLEE
jgi:predicted Zn-dependent protease